MGRRRWPNTSSLGRVTPSTDIAVRATCDCRRPLHSHLHPADVDGGGPDHSSRHTRALGADMLSAVDLRIDAAFVACRLGGGGYTVCFRSGHEWLTAHCARVPRRNTSMLASSYSPAVWHL
ncbi:unnamed protein product [Closterium sp. NIES-53]